MEEFNKALERVEQSNIVQDIKENPSVVVADCNDCGCELREDDISYETKTKTLGKVCHAHAKAKTKAKKRITRLKKAAAAKKNPTMAKKIEGFTHQLREGHMPLKNPMNSLQQNANADAETNRSLAVVGRTVYAMQLNRAKQSYEEPVKQF